MAAEFLIATCQRPWAQGKLLTVEEIIALAEERMPARITRLDREELDLLDPYGDTRVANDPTDEHPPILEAVSEWALEALSDMLRMHETQYAEIGSGVSAQWITGGMSTGEPPTDVYDTIKALDMLGLFNDSISTAEIQWVRERIARRSAERMQKRG